MKEIAEPFLQSNGNRTVLATMIRLTMVTGRKTSAEDPMELVFCNGVQHFYCPLTADEKITLIHVLNNGST